MVLMCVFHKQSQKGSCNMVHNCVLVELCVIINVSVCTCCVLLVFSCSRHLSVSIDGVVGSCLSVFEQATGLVPKFEVHGGTRTENLALQNVQVVTVFCVLYNY